MTLSMFNRARDVDVLGHAVHVRRLPEHLSDWAARKFRSLWALHPADHGALVTPSGRSVPLPRWQVPYDRAYEYPGAPRVEAPPMPVAFHPLCEWLADNIDARLNGAVVNWYDADAGHYIGQHRDRTEQLVEGSPIVSMSLGADRTMRFSRKGAKSVDVDVIHGDVIVIPWATNLALLHGIPKPRAAECGRRISLTARVVAGGTSRWRGRNK